MYRYGNKGCAHCCGQHIQGSLATIGQGNLCHLRFREAFLQGFRQHPGHLAGGQALLERIRCNNNFHFGG